MRKIVVILIMALGIACNNSKPSEQLNSSSDWRLTIETYGFMGPTFKTNINSSDDSMFVGRWEFVEDSITKTSNSTLVMLNAAFVSKADKDSIYNITRRIIQEFNFPKESNKIKDGSNISIKLEQNNTSVSCDYKNVTDIKNPSVNVAKLVEIINKPLKPEEKIY